MTTDRHRATAAEICGLFGLLLLAVVGCGPGAEGTPPKAGDRAAAVSAPPWFEERARRAGLEFVCESGHHDRLLFPEIMPGGAALLDMDNDGDLDVYLVQAGSLTESGTPRSRNQLFRNDGGETFVDVTEGSGADDRGYGMGATAGDYDNDGDVDLYVNNFEANALLRNDGNGKFSDVTEESGTGNASWSVSSAFLDYDKDGDLDLYVANYVGWTPGGEIDCYNSFGALDYCLPTNYKTPAMDALLRNEGDGTFSDVTKQAGLNAKFGNGLGVAVGDFDDNGWLDVFVANDTNMDQLWLNQGDGTFIDEALLRGCALDQHGAVKAGMGVATADLDDNGKLDLLVVNITTESDSFFRNEGGYFADRTALAGLGTESLAFTRFGTGLIDFDNDGYLDLYQACGMVQLSAEPPAGDPFAESNLLYKGGPDGRFDEVSPQAGVAEDLAFTSRGAAFGDLNNDGGIDIVVVNRDAPTHLMHNVVRDRGNWITFDVREEHGRHALGASVTLNIGTRRVRRDVAPAFSYGVGNDPRVHFGLGEHDRAVDVQVRWVDGGVESFGDFETGGIVVLERGTGTR
jgi:hypothetical protein